MTASSPRPIAEVLQLPTAAALLARLRAREPAAAGMLFDRHAAAVERAVAGVLGPDAEVDDVVQDAFVAALRGIDRFRGEESSLAAWVRGIAVRLALKKLRWRRARRWLAGRGTDDVQGAHATTDPHAQTVLARAFTMLDRLPVIERAAFGMRFLEGMQLDEIAEALGISLATVKRRLTSARARFDELAAADALLREWIDGEEGR